MKWTKEEEELLRQHYPYTPKEELRTMLNGRSWTSIISRATLLGVHRQLLVYPERARKTKAKKEPISKICEWMEERMDLVGVVDMANRRELYRERDRGDCQFSHHCSHARPECMSARPLPEIGDPGKDSNAPKPGGLVPGYKFNTSQHI